MCWYVNLILALTVTWFSNKGQAYENEVEDYPPWDQNSYNNRATPQNNYNGQNGQNLQSQPGQHGINNPSQDYGTGQLQTGQNLHSQPSHDDRTSQPQTGKNVHSQPGQNIIIHLSQDYRTGQPQTQITAGHNGNGVKGNIGVNMSYWNGYRSDFNGVNANGDYKHKLDENGGEIVSPNFSGEHQLHLLWHVGIYSKSYTPYMQICGGTLVTMEAVITAAHCFWRDGLLPTKDYAVGAGKLYRPWADTHDGDRQTSDVSAIHIPDWFRGSLTSFQADIAVVTLARRLVVSHAVRPACVSFDEALDEEQLAEGNRGTVLGWGLTQPDGKESPVLNYLELPVVPVAKCLSSASADFFKYITSDKICAGVTTGKALCRGDSGGGLVFADTRAAPPAPHLRAVASTAPRDDAHACNAYALAALTHVAAHRAFLRRHVPGLEAECRKHYQYPSGGGAIDSVEGSMQRKGDKFVYVTLEMDPSEVVPILEAATEATAADQRRTCRFGDRSRIN